jgi:hypothetical protein
MRRIKDHGEAHCAKNVRLAWENYSDGKGKRQTIQDFEKSLDSNLQLILDELINGEWSPSPYKDKVIFERKKRVLAKAPVHDHVLETAAILPFERSMYDYICWQSPAVRPNLGTHALFRFLRNDLYRSSQKECYYNITMDAHHYFPRMDHHIEKTMIARKIKPGPLRDILYKVIESYPWGSPLGIKISQITGQIYLSSFDRLAIRCFDILSDTEKLSYWTQRYITNKIASASKEDYLVLCRGPSFMASRFRNFLSEGLRHYYRFVDNIIILHEDKTFLHIITEIAIMILAHDFHIVINKDWNIRPTWMGIRLCGYQFYHEHTLPSKDNKQKTARNIHKLVKKGFTEEQIRIKCSSQLGYIKHADCRHLLKILGMENSIGKIIKRHRVKSPFNGLNGEDKVKFLSICKMLNENNEGTDNGWNKEIMLIDYVIEDSKIEKTTMTVSVPDSEGHNQTVTKTVPNKVLSIRFKKIIKIRKTKDANGKETEHYEYEKRKDKDGNDTLLDWEHYTFTGSKVLIDQAMNDFSREDLPAPTIITQFKGKNGNNSFFKFT